MYSDKRGGNEDRVKAATALRHVLVFQLKLAADAVRDFVLSPLSILAFLVDVISKPSAEKSLYLRLMVLGRRSDRMINLFDDYADDGDFTIDRAVDELETVLRAGPGQPGSDDRDTEGGSVKDDEDSQKNR